MVTTRMVRGSNGGVDTKNVRPSLNFFQIVIRFPPIRILKIPFNNMHQYNYSSFSLNNGISNFTDMMFFVEASVVSKLQYVLFASTDSYVSLTFKIASYLRHTHHILVLFRLHVVLYAVHVPVASADAALSNNRRQQN
jgi:hypothetical protein